MRRHRDKERGATLVEAAISYSLLFVAIFAVLEFGLAFGDWLTVSHATRDGARAGATFGSAPDADFEILRQVEGVMVPKGMPVGTAVRVFEAAPLGPGTTYTYAPGTGCGSTTVPPLPGCCDWTPCPQPGRIAYVPPVWDPVNRDVEAPATDRLGVEITFTHQWLTGLFSDSTDLTTATDFQLEPEIFAPAP